VTRISIGKIVVDAACLGGQDADMFRQSLEREFAQLLRGEALSTLSNAVASLNGGQVETAPGGLAQAVARQVVQSLRSEA
jgi:hypothetical protein